MIIIGIFIGIVVVLYYWYKWENESLEIALKEERTEKEYYQELMRETIENGTLLISENKKQDRFNESMEMFFGEILSDFQKDDKGYWWKVGDNTDLWLFVGMDDGKLHYTFWSNKANKKYDKYRLPTNGYEEWLQIWQEADRNSKRYFEELDAYDSMLDSRIKSLAESIHWFYKEKTYHGKTIEDIIKECNKNQ